MRTHLTENLICGRDRVIKLIGMMLLPTPLAYLRTTFLRDILQNTTGEVAKIIAFELVIRLLYCAQENVFLLDYETLLL
jgi:hypothetical protein